MSRFDWVKDIFKRNAPLENAIEEAVREQLVFETQHPVRFDADQRRVRLLQVVMRRFPKTNPVLVQELVAQALEVVEQQAGR